jgi:hypothetical protein
MSMNSFGHLFRVTTWGESHGPALGATVDGCPPGVAITPEMIQHWLDSVNRVRTNIPPSAARPMRCGFCQAFLKVSRQARQSSL